MGRDRGRHRRRSIRLKDYDYAQPGAYFVTICTHRREMLFGEVVDDQMCLNPAGEMVWRWWDELNQKFETVRTDAAVVMPNHFHGIVTLVRATPVRATLVGATLGGRPDNVHTHVGATPRVPSRRGRPDDPDTPVRATHVGATLGGRPDDAPSADPGTAAQVPLGQVVGWFKTMTTNAYIHGVKKQGWPRFPGKVWQRNYYEHIVRDDEALQEIRAYIETNPERWALDRENPERSGVDELECRIYGRPGEAG